MPNPVQQNDLDIAEVRRSELVGIHPSSGMADAFGRVRVSNPQAIFDSKLLAGDKNPLRWDEALESGSGISGSTPTADKPFIDFTSTVSTAGKYTRQTLRHFDYQPGKSQLVLMSGVLSLSGGGTGVERRIGPFEDGNGLFFEDDQGTIGVTVRSSVSGSVVDNTVVQADWNLDIFDGNNGVDNPSGLQSDFSKLQVFVIDFQWPGRVRFGLDIGGTLFYVHQFTHDNVIVDPYMSTPNLPLRYQMITTADSPASTMRVISSVVSSEGGFKPIGIVNSHSTTDHVNANTADTVYALFGIRLSATTLGCEFELLNASILSETNDNFEWLLIQDPTVAGTFVYANKDNSCCQVATGDGSGDPSANTVTGGHVIERGFGVAKAVIALGLDESFSLGADIDGTLGTVVLCVRPLTANADLQGALNWREFF